LGMAPGASPGAIRHSVLSRREAPCETAPVLVSDDTLGPRYRPAMAGPSRSARTVADRIGSPKGHLPGRTMTRDITAHSSKRTCRCAGPPSSPGVAACSTPGAATTVVNAREHGNGWRSHRAIAVIALRRPAAVRWDLPMPPLAVSGDQSTTTPTQRCHGLTVG
jgi:hypothetical protein